MTKTASSPSPGRNLRPRCWNGKLNLDAGRIAEQVKQDLLDTCAICRPHSWRSCAPFTFGSWGVKTSRWWEPPPRFPGRRGYGRHRVPGTGRPASCAVGGPGRAGTGGVVPSVVTQLRGSIPPGTYGIVSPQGTHQGSNRRGQPRRPEHDQLVDGPELADVLAENKIGVKNTMILVPRLDTEVLTERLEAEQG